tara:strand:- start:1237 stop:2127 length:891 start_codon:yes stop_codon:yes gene_type:complete
MTIGIDPFIFRDSIVLSWHGFFTFVGVGIAIYLIDRWSTKEDIDSDVIYSVALWVIIGGILGARLVHVIDRWDYYQDNLGYIYQVWRGGIALYGALIFGTLSGLLNIFIRKYLGLVYAGQKQIWFKNLVGEKIAKGYLQGNMYAKFKDLSIGKLLDLVAPAMAIGQTFGRLGDVINGEHISRKTDLVWGTIYSHPDSGSFTFHGLNPSHPVIIYEMILTTFAFIILWNLRGRLGPPGMIFISYAIIYSIGRFFIQFMRLDSVWFAGLQEAHLISLLVLTICVPILALRASWTSRTN